MSQYRSQLPQLSGKFFLTDAGLETDLIFNQGMEIREFAAHTLLSDEGGRRALTDYLKGFIELASECDAGLILDSQTWKAHPHWAASLEVSVTELEEANHEAIGVVRAAQKFSLPLVISFTVETDGRLPSGQSLGEAIRAVDDATAGGAAYFMVNCAHPDHFVSELGGSDWPRRIRGLRCNASRKSHAELDQCTALDDGNPEELASQYTAILSTMPWLNVFGGCCGTDLRHVTRIAHTVKGRFA